MVFISTSHLSLRLKDTQKAHSSYLTISINIVLAHVSCLTFRFPFIWGILNILPQYFTSVLVSSCPFMTIRISLSTSALFALYVHVCSAVSDSLQPLDYSPPGSFVHRAFLAGTLEFLLPFPTPGDLSDPGIEPASHKGR